MWGQHLHSASLRSAHYVSRLSSLPLPLPSWCLQMLALVLLTCRLGMLAAEAAAPLKLLERGVSKEALAGLVRLLLCGC